MERKTEKQKTVCAGTDPPQITQFSKGTPQSLCCFCGNACRAGCSWAESFIPVKGWVAEENKKGWFVKSCPEYIDDGWMRDPTLLNTDGCVNLLEEVIGKLREDYMDAPKQRVAIEHFILSERAKELFWFTDPELIVEHLRSEARKQKDKGKVKEE